MKGNYHFSIRGQQGSVLLIAMVILVVLTLLTFASARGVLLQEKMSATARDSILALEVAEAAVRDAQQNILSAAVDYADAGPSSRYCAAGCPPITSASPDGADCVTCDYKNVMQNLWDDSLWANAERVSTAANAINCGNGVAGCRLFGEFMIIRIGKANLTLSGAGDIGHGGTDETVDHNANQATMFKYKIIARGRGLDPDNTRVIVSYFAAR